MTRPRGSVSISSRLTTGSTASSESPWKSPDWASTSSTARPLATDVTDAPASVSRGSLGGCAIRHPIGGRARPPTERVGSRTPAVRQASDHRRIGGAPAAAAASSPPEQGTADPGRREGLDLAGGRRVEEVGDLTGGRRPPQGLLDPLHHEQEGDQQRREEDDAEGDHRDLLSQAPRAAGAATA